MICIDKKLIFIHLPKTGGYTIKNILEPHSPDVLKRGFPTLFGENTGMRMWDYRTKMMIMHPNVEFYEMQYPDKFDDFTTFTVIRNPWDRLLSYVLWLNKGEFDREKFISALNLKVSGWFGNQYDMTQIPLLKNSDGEVMVNKVFRYDIFKKELKAFFDEHEIEYGNQLETKTNSASSNRHYSTYYDDEMRKLVARICAEEIEYFDFKFEGE
jgi:hypothetical protein